MVLGKGNILAFIIWFSAYCLTFAQHDDKSEQELKNQAREFFKNEKYGEALPLYSQLLSLYPKDPNFAYHFGACRLFAETNKQDPVKILERASRKPNVDPEVYYFLGKAYHLNYRFNEAVAAYSKYRDGVKKHAYPVKRDIETCWNGMSLLKKITDIGVYEKKIIAEEDFFRAYKFDDFEGKIIRNLEEFQSKYDISEEYSTVMHFKRGAEKIYYSSYGENGENGKDIYVITMQESGEYGDPQPLGSNINTPHDEEFPYLHPSGQILYFASKGHNSMGGYDIFKSELGPGGWGPPVNVDFAINTPADDYLFITDKSESTAYFASNRESKHGFITVYKVSTERVPVREVAIKGDFLSKDTKNAKITIENTVTGVKLESFNTDTSTGQYVLKVPNGGKFKFYVEADKGHAVHTGFVNVPIQNSFVTLRQEISLEGEGDGEKIRIINHFGDESEEFSLIPEFLLEKAALSVDTSNLAASRAEALKEMYDSMEKYDNSKDSAFSDGSIEQDTMEAYQAKIVEEALNYATGLQTTSHELWTDAEIAYNFAKEKKIESLRLKKQSDELEAQDPDKSKELKKNSAKMAKEADISFDYGDLYKTKSSEFELDAQKIILIADKITSTEDPAEKSSLTQQIKGVYEELIEKHEKDEVDRNYITEIQEKKREAAAERQKVRELEATANELVAEISELKAKAAKAKKKDRDPILQQSLELETELAEINQQLIEEDKKIAEIEKNLALLENESELYLDVENVIAKHDTTNIEHLSEAELTKLETEIEEAESNNSYDEILTEELQLDKKSPSNENENNGDAPLVSIQNLNEDTSAQDTQLDVDTNTTSSDLASTNDKEPEDTVSTDVPLVSIVETDSNNTTDPQNNGEIVNNNGFLEKNDAEPAISKDLSEELKTLETELKTELEKIPDDNSAISQEEKTQALNNWKQRVDDKKRVLEDKVAAGGLEQQERKQMLNEIAYLDQLAQANSLQDIQKANQNQNVKSDIPKTTENKGTESILAQNGKIEEVISGSESETVNGLKEALEKNKQTPNVENQAKVQEELDKAIASLQNDVQNEELSTDEKTENQKLLDELLALNDQIQDNSNQNETELQNEKQNSNVSDSEIGPTPTASDKDQINNKIEESIAGNDLPELNDLKESIKTAKSDTSNNNQTVAEELDKAIASLEAKSSDGNLTEEEKEKNDAVLANLETFRNELKASSEAKSSNVQDGTSNSQSIPEVQNQQEMDGIAENLIEDGLATNYIEFKEKEQQAIKNGASSEDIQKINEDWAASIALEIDSLKKVQNNESDDSKKAEIQGQIDNLEYLSKQKTTRSEEIAALASKSSENQNPKNLNDSTQTDATQTDANQTDANQTDANQTDANQTDATQTDATQTDATQTDATQTDATQTDTTQTDATQTDATQTDATQTDATQTDTTQTDATQTDATQTDATQTDANQTDATQTDANQTDATQTDATQTDATQTGGIQQDFVFSASSDIEDQEIQDFLNKSLPELGSAMQLNLEEDLTQIEEQSKAIADSIAAWEEEIAKIQGKLAATKKKKKRAVLESDLQRYQDKVESEKSRQKVLSMEKDALSLASNNTPKNLFDEQRESISIGKEVAKLEEGISQTEESISIKTQELDNTKKKKIRRKIESDLKNLEAKVSYQRIILAEQKEALSNMKKLERSMVSKALVENVIAPNAFPLASGAPDNEIQKSDDVKTFSENRVKTMTLLKAALNDSKSAEERKILVKDINDQISVLELELEKTEDEEQKKQLSDKIALLTQKADELMRMADSLLNASRNNQSQALEAIGASSDQLLALEQDYAKKVILTPYISEEIVQVDTLQKPKEKVEVEVEIDTPFVQTNPDESAYNEEKPIPIDVPIPSGLIFKVQVGAFRNPIPQDLFKGFSPIMGENRGSGITRYTAGSFGDFANADNAKEQIRNLGYRDAFVVAYLNGERISISKARQMSTDQLANNSGTAQNGETTSVNKFGVTEQNVAAMSGVFFTVQIGVYTRPASLSELYNINPVVSAKTENGMIRYSSGTYNAFSVANQAKTEIRAKGIRDAFVTAYFNGKRISVAEAKNLVNNGTPTYQGNASPASQGENKSPSQSENKTFGTNDKAKNGTFFSIQVGAYTSNIPISAVEVYLEITRQHTIFVQDNEGLKLYLTGLTKDFDEISALLPKIKGFGLQDAFIVGLDNGQKIEVAKAKELINNE
ncbi:MAG: hypothetical protein MRY83_20280 [Flavobacteriales bacterium]|nr:hypothetical protein [Flavobacteriales bacterium]